MTETIKTKITKVTGENEGGESRQVLISKYVSELDSLELEREFNSADKNAIAVYATPSENLRFKVGYISPALSPRIVDFWNEDKIVVCYVTNVFGREEDFLGIECEITVTTSEEIKAQSHAFAVEQQKAYELKRYGIKTLRAIFGVIFLFLWLMSLFIIDSFSSFVIALVIFLVPAVILLLPWVRWLYDRGVRFFQTMQK
jgi:hypothetical protein